MEARRWVISARLVKSTALVTKTMGKPVTTTPEHGPAAVREHWRFIEKADAFGITPAKILAPHRKRTIERMRTQETVLCVQDGTDISLSTRPQYEVWRRPVATRPRPRPVACIACDAGLERPDHWACCGARTGRRRKRRRHISGLTGCATWTRRPGRCRARRACFA